MRSIVLCVPLGQDALHPTNLTTYINMHSRTLEPSRAALLQVDYYPHLSVGRVGILVTPEGAGPSTNGTVSMFPGNASVVSTLTDSSDGKTTVTRATRVLENNAIITTFVCTSQAGSTCSATLSLSDTDGNHYGVAQDDGAASDGTSVWWRKENIHDALNPAYLGSCNAHLPLQSTERMFTVDASSGDLRMANGSCLWYDNTTTSGIVTSGACTAPNGAWTWRGNATNGDIVHKASFKCLAASSTLKLGECGSMPWAQVPSNSSNTSLVYISAAGAGCIVVVPDNNNNTLGVSVGVADASGVLVKGTPARVSAKDASAGMTLTLSSLVSGAEYTIIVGVQTLRDSGCAGIRPQWETCTTSPEDAATALVQSMAASSARDAAVQASRAFWSDFWAASEVDLTSGATPNATGPLGIVERWYVQMTTHLLFSLSLYVHR